MKLVLDSIGQELRLGTFPERLRLQKKVYLTQLTGLDLGYRFSWYLHGPYCRELTSDAFRLMEQVRERAPEDEARSLTATTRGLAAKATKIWADEPAGQAEDDWLELLASLHYLKHISFWPQARGRDFEDVFAALIESKPRFRDRRADAALAWGRLEQVGLIQRKVLPAP
ncbi:MAG TPA: hypothetical protein VFV75_12780 [Candidatus Polarisedimenticolaceae bacterium]|nr:hypothetical protein [Candidatus Polarisedimenticolaceae bacterium]